MLVVTRRPNERIVFPSLGITVEVLKLAKGAARIGIEAPLDVRILRDELLQHGEAAPDRSDRHGFANILSRAMLAIHLAQKQVEAGRSAEAMATLEMALSSLEAIERSRPSPSPPAPALPRRCSALIVEDDANERELLAGFLSMNGCECEVMGDGEDALAYLDAGGRPDVILLDMAMPRCDGPTTLRRIRGDQRYQGLKVFSVSGTSPRELDISDGPDGFDAWFSKPLNPRRLWEAMQRSVRDPNSTS